MKPIEYIQIGDLISSYNPTTQQVTTGEVVSIVEYTQDLPAENYVFNGFLEVTPVQTMFINEVQWLESSYAGMGAVMLENPPGSQDINPINIISKTPIERTGHIYDLIVEPVSGEAIGYWANGILVGGYD
jgi:hypothetical protein